MTARPSSRGGDTLPGIAPGFGAAPAVQPSPVPAPPVPPPAVQPSPDQSPPAVATVSTPCCLLSLLRANCQDHDLSGPASFAAHTLGREPRPVGSARRFSELTLRNWGLGTIEDNVAVITSELVTNALRYGLPARGRLTAPGQVRMGLVRQGSALLCAIFDPATKVPVMRDADPLAESGRGLHVVAALSDSWGWTPPDSSGKAVWALLSATAPADGALGADGTL